MHKKADQQQKYYFSDKLKRQLAQITYYPLTVVEAPSGFGKTTAVREYLRETLLPDTREYWYTCLGESAALSWAGICSLFANLSPALAEDLKSLNMPSTDGLYDLAARLRNVPCETETYLIIDNYQLVDCYAPRELINAFSMHGNPNLHMIFITQQLESMRQTSVHNDNIYSIGASSFFFDRAGTASLFRMEGIRLSDEELEKLYMSTEGWVSALRLQIINFKETGSFAFNADIEQLVENAIWNKLLPEEKDFLLSVSVLESFTARQAAIMLGRDNIPKAIETLLKSSDFIRYIPDKHLYSIHGILQDYLRNRLYHFESESYQNLVFSRAGASCAATGQYHAASEFYYKVKDFDAILSLPFTQEYLDREKEKSHWDFIAAILRECPEEVIFKHPSVIIVFCYQTLIYGQFDIYRRLCLLFEAALSRGVGLSPEELHSIKGEYMLLSALRAFNDLPKMREGLLASWEILGKPSSVLRPNTPWFYATPSVLNMFWREPGGLESTLALMDEAVILYYRLADNHGAGSHWAMRAEAMLLRGEDDEAEILCHKALYDARGQNQTCICLCAELILARIAILRGDAEGYFAAVRNIQSYAKADASPSIQRLTEHCMSIIGLLLGIRELVAPWFSDMVHIREALYMPVVPFAQRLHLELLLADKRYNLFFGLCELALDSARHPPGSIRQPMLLVQLSVLMAIAKRGTGDHEEAGKFLREALELALPDRVLLPFAHYGCMETLLTESGPLLRGLNAEALSALKELCRRQQKGVAAIRKAVLQAESPLTPREKEIAQLAKARLSAREIADMLYISEMTVRATLRSVYSKLEIHSKAELILKDF
jgi:LuxR family maltose regulon positive regulatory protein